MLVLELIHVIKKGPGHCDVFGFTVSSMCHWALLLIWFHFNPNMDK